MDDQSISRAEYDKLKEQFDAIQSEVMPPVGFMLCDVLQVTLISSSNVILVLLSS
jgi:hypothetical protein